MKNYKVNYVDVKTGEKLAYRSAGSGDNTYLLIHGNMSSSIHWSTLMEKLESHSKVYGVDLRGFGDSSYNGELNSLQDFAQDVKEFILELGLDNLIVVGWSTGGGIALELAVMGEVSERIKKVVLLDSVGIQGYPIMRKDEEGTPIPGDFLKEKSEIAVDAVQVAPILYAYESKNKD
ncbi:MAG: alpha/beta hydrolase, partial [Gallicola sp.]|nr:alpha/beta hydrolase [Gallicola sp.]